MSPQFTFLEIHDFDLDNFIPFMGWIGAKPIKIYTNETTTSYYLYEEESGRLFELHSEAPNRHNAKFLYDKVLKEYIGWCKSDNPG